jgi:hypothetical protein
MDPRKHRMKTCVCPIKSRLNFPLERRQKELLRKRGTTVTSIIILPTQKETHFSFFFVISWWLRWTCCSPACKVISVQMLSWHNWVYLIAPPGKRVQTLLVFDELANKLAKLMELHADFSLMLHTKIYLRLLLIIVASYLHTGDKIDTKGI